MSLPNRFLKSFGNSMLPILHDQDIVETLTILRKKIKVDEIVYYAFGRGYITHRVIYANPQKKWVLTKGDNNLMPDKKVQKSKILGKVNLIHRKGDSIQLNDYYLFQSTYYFDEIKLLKKKLEAAGINFVFLKGLPVHLYYNKSYPKRDFADCDLLFNKQDRYLIHEILTNLGYKLELSDKSLLHNLSKEDVHSYEYSKIRGMFKVIFDIHYKIALLETKLGSTELLYPASYSDNLTQQLINKSISITIDGEKYRILNHNYLIVYLATHIFHHNFKGYHRYSFLADVIQKKLPDMLEIYRIATKYKLENYIYAVFILYNKFYSPRIKLDIFEKSLNNKIKKTSKRIAKRINIFADEDLFSSAFHRLQFIYTLTQTNFILINGLFLLFAIKSIVFLKPKVWNKIIHFCLRKILFTADNFFSQKRIKKMIDVF